MKKTGFTMIELLVVVVILGILASIAAMNVRINLVKSRDAARKVDLNSIQKALEMYQGNFGLYPLSLEGRITDDTGNALVWGEPFVDSKGTIYMVQLPIDPISNPEYCYFVSDPPKLYRLFAKLENTKDRDCITQDCIANVSCFESGYNYGVSSTNTLPAPL